MSEKEDLRHLFNMTPKERFAIIDKVSNVNIISNLIIGVIKIVIAVISGSFAIASDSVINFGDTIAAIFTRIGDKVSIMSPTKKHPYGLGRVEYLAIIIAAFVMIFVSGILVTVSIEHIIHPPKVEINFVEYFIIFLIVLSKFWLYYYNIKKSEETFSGELEAVAHDALIDAIGTSIVCILLFIDHFVHVELDGYISLGVAISIIISNVIDIFKTISLMLGTKPNQTIIDEIKKTALSVPYVENVRNILIHSYGYKVHYGSMDLDLPDNMDTGEVSKKLKELETLLFNKYDISFTFGISADNEKYNSPVKSPA